MKKTALGKGLGALMGDVEEIDAPAGENTGVKEVDISSIDRDETQPRKDFDDEKLSELAASIKTHGVMQPLIVVKNGARYTIVAGERRYRAARKAGVKKLPVIVKQLSKKDILEISLIENIQREDLNAVEQSDALLSLMRGYSLTQEEAAERVGKSRSAIANLVRLAALPQSVKKMIVSGDISAGHARALLPLKDSDAIKAAADTVIKKALSVRGTEELVRCMLQPKTPAPAKKAVSPEWRDAEKKLSAALDTKVSLAGSDKKGRILIEYYSKEQLLELFDKLTGK